MDIQVFLLPWLTPDEAVEPFEFRGVQGRRAARMILRPGFL
jgi:hypothetical protein